MATLETLFGNSRLGILGVNTSAKSGRFTHSFVHTGTGREINTQFGLPSLQTKHKKNHNVFPTLRTFNITNLANFTRPSLSNRSGFGL